MKDRERARLSAWLARLHFVSALVGGLALAGSAADVLETETGNSNGILAGSAAAWAPQLRGLSDAVLAGPVHQFLVEGVVQTYVDANDTHVTRRTVLIAFSGQSYDVVGGGEGTSLAQGEAARAFARERVKWVLSPVSNAGVATGPTGDAAR